ncbi:MAG: hypothetical protein ACI4C4_13975 [Lachnospiraceae bacterium]
MKRIAGIISLLILMIGIYQYAKVLGQYEENTETIGGSSALGEEPCAEEISISEETQQANSEADMQYREMEKFYNKKLYLDSIAAKMDQVNGSTVYIDRYFRIGKEDLTECGKVGFLNGHFGGVIFQIDQGMWLQYSSDNVNDLEEELLPRSLIITDDSMNLGFMDARAGMNFEEIQENAYAGEIQEGFMYHREEKVYCIQYSDEYYEYIFLSNNQDGRDSELIVPHK